MEVQSTKAIFCYCMYGGELVRKPDGSIEYEGGARIGVRLDYQKSYDDFVNQVCTKANVDPSTVTIKYTIENNKNLLVDMRGQDDLLNILDFNSVTAELYIFKADDRKGDELQETRCSESAVPSGVVAEINSPPPQELGSGSRNSSQSCSHHISPNESTGGSPLLSAFWKHSLKGLNQIFESANDFRDALNKFSVANHFTYKFVKNDKVRLRARCVVDNCGWMVSASVISGTNMFRIYKYKGVHTHISDVDSTVKTKTSRRWLANVVVDKVRDTPEYLPMEIVNDLQRNYGVKISYHQAWRSKELANSLIYGDHKDSYKLLPWLCQRIVESNPGSFACYTTTEDNCFHQLFLAFHASLHGFRVGCRKAIYIDDIQLTGKYKGTLVAATAMDSDDGLFPVAFGVAGDESYDDWKWFLKKLKEALDYDENIVFVSDRHPNVIQAVRDVFGSRSHAYCLHYLSESFKTYMKVLQLSSGKREVLVSMLESAAYARTREVYDACLNDIQSISQEAHKWILDSEPGHWANSLFPGKRWDKLTTNYAECYNLLFSEVQDKPIIDLVNRIGHKLGDTMHERHIEVKQWTKPVGNQIDDKLKTNISWAEALRVYQKTNFEFDVSEGQVRRSVNLQARTCTCMVWQMTDLPCMHACASIKYTNSQVHLYVDGCYLKETYELIYSELPHVVSTVDSPPLSTLVDGLHPPRTQVQIGRPKRKKIKSHEVDRRLLHCSRCNESGHNRRSCPAAS